MIPRYCTDEMTEIWLDENKFTQWLKVELAVLRAKADMDIISDDVYPRIKSQACFRIKEIYKIEEKTHHDMVAFVREVQSHLEDKMKGYFHSNITSYDIEEPALARMLINSMDVILKSLTDLMRVVKEKAVQYKHLVKIGRTHCQHAEPITLGLTFLSWYDQLQRQAIFLDICKREIQYSKISGAVGTYASGLSPELERLALSYLELKPADISTQIISRDRHAHLMNSLAVFAGVIENIALNIRLHAQTEIGEMQEPFGKNQTASSIMPHKRNPILNENLCGLARVVRANAGIALENISTWEERDISQSSPERIIFPDSLNLVHFMIKRLSKVVSGLVVNEDKIKENLELTRGVIFSGDIKELFIKYGMKPDEAYKLAQECAFEAMKYKKSYFDILVSYGKIPLRIRYKECIDELTEIFKMENKLKYVNEVFARFNM